MLLKIFDELKGLGGVSDNLDDVHNDEPYVFVVNCKSDDAVAADFMPEEVLVLRASLADEKPDGVVDRVDLVVALLIDVGLDEVFILLLLLGSEVPNVSLIELVGTAELVTLDVEGNNSGTVEVADDDPCAYRRLLLDRIDEILLVAVFDDEFSGAEGLLEEDPQEVEDLLLLAVDKMSAGLLGVPLVDPASQEQVSELPVLLLDLLDWLLLIPVVEQLVILVGFLDLLFEEELEVLDDPPEHRTLVGSLWTETVDELATALDLLNTGIISVTI